MNVFAISEILLPFFPVVLHRVILEYIIPTQHEFELYKTLKISKMAKNTIDSYVEYYIDENCVYIHENGTLSIDMTNKYSILHSSNRMYMYKNYMYVLDYLTIHVFNKNCKKIRTIHNFVGDKIFSIIKITADKIILGHKYSVNIIIMDLYGKNINNICTKNGGLYYMDVHNKNIYMLLFNESICVYSSGGTHLKTYNFHKIDDCLRIEKFYIIDDILYIHCRNTDDIYEVVDSADTAIIIKKNKYHDKYNPYEYWSSLYKNGYLYVSSTRKLESIIVYKVISSTDILSKLK